MWVGGEAFLRWSEREEADKATTEERKKKKRYSRLISLLSPGNYHSSG